jgi:UDP-N-acetyl-D-glucosamine dehydrogenase
MHDVGYEVICVDIDEERIATLQDGVSPVEDVADGEVNRAQEAGLLFTTEYNALTDVDGVSICVPTPLRKTDTPDVSYVMDAAERLAPIIPEDSAVVLESTVYPGATEEVVGETLAQNGVEIGEDIHLAFSPERIDPGNKEYGAVDIPKVIGGVTPESGDRAEALYGPVFDEVVRVDSATEAELVKLLENTFRAVNIGLINELAQVAYELDVDIWNVIEAAKTKPFGFMPFYPGPGLGGHCIPVDPFFLSWKANEYGIETRFIELADSVNREMPGHVVQRVVEQLNEEGIAPSDADILLIGAAYKPNVSDTRESPAIDILSGLLGWDASVNYHDPHVPQLNVGTEVYESVPLTDDRLQSSDCVVIVTDHDAIDMEEVVGEAPRIFDSRNAADGLSHPNLVRL